MTICTCPKCGQPIPFEQVRRLLSPTKLALLTVLEGAGRHGFSLDEIGEGLRARGVEPKNAHTLRTHILQLDALIEGTGYRVARTQSRTPTRWALLTDNREQAA